VLVRSGVEEKTSEFLPPAVVARRVCWCADLVGGMTTGLLAERWNASDVARLASGVDAGDQPLPSNAWMAVRRLGRTATPAEGLKVNDRVVRMAQEQAGRTLRSAGWRADVTAGIDRVADRLPLRGGALPRGGRRSATRSTAAGNCPGSVIKGRIRQIARFARAEGRLPADVFELEGLPRVARMLLLAACDAQQATLARDGVNPRAALLRLQLPGRPDPRGYRDRSWVAIPLRLPVTVPDRGALHPPALRLVGGRVYADVAFSHAVPKAARTGHTVALGVDWGLNTLLSAGAVRLDAQGRLRTLGAGARFRAAGVLAKQHRLRRLSQKLHAKADHCRRSPTAAHAAGGRPRTRLWRPATPPSCRSWRGSAPAGPTSTTP
jgi:hypothetical protein